MPEIKTQIKLSKDRIKSKAKMFQTDIIGTLFNERTNLEHSLSDYYMCILNGKKLFFKTQWNNLDQKAFFEAFQIIINFKES
jgi:hypothetical protein